MRASTPRRTSGIRRATRRRVAAVSVAILAVTALAACHSATAADASLPSRGGTLNVILANQPINNLDPQRVLLANDSNVSHLLDRTLTTTNAAGLVVPDLATDTGRPSDDNQVWEFTLKQGLKWQDGSPVTCQDVQYGIERRFDANFSGLDYPVAYLTDNTPSYKGPFVKTGADPAVKKTLESIVCIDNSTIQFHLNKPYGDFGYTVSVSTFAPMNRTHDVDHSLDDSKTSTNFDPFSDGPYEVSPKQTTIAGDSVDGYYASTLTLIRNPFWNPATDSVRKAYPNQIVFTYNRNRPQVTNALIQSATPFYQNAIDLDSDVSSQFVQQVVNDPTLSKRAISGFQGATRYFAIDTQRVTNVDCRRALEYAFDKYAWRAEAGGPILGQLATSMIPPNLQAHANFDIYDTNSQPDGEPIKAAALWKGHGCPSTVKIAYPDIVGLPQQMSTVVHAYQLAGISVTLMPISQETYYNVIGNPRGPYDMIYAGWVPDWANGSAVIPPLFGSTPVKTALAHPDDANDQVNNNNYSMVIDPSLDAGITDAFKSDLTDQYHLWGQLDEQVMKDAYAIPLLYGKALRMSGSNVRGAVMSPAYGEPDLSGIGVVS